MKSKIQQIDNINDAFKKSQTNKKETMSEQFCKIGRIVSSKTGEVLSFVGDLENVALKLSQDERSR